ncbi:hypothetical protein BH10ACI4_BH10ACI4_35550 [soil metagenome]
MPVQEPVPRASTRWIVKYVLAASLCAAALPCLAAATVVVPTSVIFTLSTPAILIYGQTVDGTAQVTASDGSQLSGTIIFLDGVTPLCTITVPSSVPCPASAGTGFAAGVHRLTATYGGDSGHSGSTSNAVMATILPDTPTATLGSSLNPAQEGNRLTLTANLKAAFSVPTGIVSFVDTTASGPILLGTGALDPSGTATLTSASLATGSHSLTAVYSATQDFTAATSPALMQFVAQIPVAPPEPVPPNPGSFAIAAGPITVGTGQSADLLVTVTALNGFTQTVQLTCGNLPVAATCEFTSCIVPVGGGTTTLRLVTHSPQNCTQTASISYTMPALAAVLLLLVPRRRSPWKSLLTLIAICSTYGLSGCGTACTSPGSYTIQITGTSVGAAPLTLSQNVQLTVLR